MRHAKNFLLLALLVGASVLPAVMPTNSIVWHNDLQRVDANVHGEALWPLLENIARQSGWNIFVEPGVTRTADVKFSGLPTGEALHKLLGDLNFALVPKTNEPSQLYVFTSQMENATQPVQAVKKPAVAKQKHVPNELIVKLKPGADIDAIAKSVGAKVVGRDDKLGIYRLEFADAASADAALAKLQTNSDVAAVDYNLIYDQPTAPRAIVNAPAAPISLTLNPSKLGDPCNPVVGLIDTQVQSLGTQLDQFMLKPVSVVGDLAANTAASPTHGTAMAYTILNAISQASGQGSSVRILPVVVYDSSETTTSWNVALGIQAAVNGGATVINMSLAGTADSAILNDIVSQALAQGIVIFAAAGNQPVSSPSYPAAIPGVNDVTALGQPGQLAPYANFSPQVDMALPGTSIVYLGNQAFVVQGTSPATAYATGVAAGTKSVNCPPWAQVQTAMQQKFPVPQK